MSISATAFIGEVSHIYRKVERIENIRTLLRDFRRFIVPYLRLSDRKDRVYIFVQKDEKEGSKAFTLELGDLNEWTELEDNQKLSDLTVLIYSEILREMHGRSLKREVAKPWVYVQK